MKQLKFLAIAAGVLALVSCNQQPAAAPEAVEVDKAAIVIENIMSRVSVRQFTEEPVAKADLETILKAGLQAPSAMNAQDWQVRIVTNQEMLNTLSGFMLSTEMGKGMAERLNKERINKARGLRRRPRVRLMSAGLRGCAAGTAPGRVCRP